MSKIDRDNLDPGEDFELIARIHRCIMIGPFLLIAAAIYIMLQARGSEAFFWVGLLGITGFYYLSKAGDTCKDSLIAVTNCRIFVIYKGSPSFSCVIRFSDISSIVTVRNNYGSLFRQADIMITCVGSSTSYYLRHVKNADVFRDMVRKYMLDADALSDKQSLGDPVIDITAADAVGRSTFHPNAVAQIVKLVNEGGLSASIIGFRVGAEEGQVVDECIRLYKGGVISQDDCERVLMRKIDF